MNEQNVHTVAGVLKLWLRELPERLIPSEALESVPWSASERARLASTVELLQKLSPYNRASLQKLCWVLNNVYQYRNRNMMGVRNISVVFAAHVLGLGKSSELMASLVRFYRIAFSIDPLPETDEALEQIAVEVDTLAAPDDDAEPVAAPDIDADAPVEVETVDEDTGMRTVERVTQWVTSGGNCGALRHADPVTQKAFLERAKAENDNIQSTN